MVQPWSAQDPQLQGCRATARHPLRQFSVLWSLLSVFCAPFASAEVGVLRTGSEDPLTCQSAASEESTKAASKPLVAALTRLHPPEEVYTHHAVLISPSNPILSGASFAADAYAALPRVLKNGNFSTAFTKFVVVGHGPQQGLEGITFGEKVCGPVDLVDTLASDYFRKHALPRLGHYVPKLLHCAETGTCKERDLSMGLAGQLPFLQAISGKGSRLQANVLPVVMHGQTVWTATRLADALALLVQPGGVWEAERVLFVFAGDLSRNLPAVQADLCDTKTAEIVSQRGVPQIAAYFDGLLSGQARDGCPGPAAAPAGYGPMLAAARVAANLKLDKRRAVVAHDGVPNKPGWASFSGPVLGFMYVIFWKEIRSEGEQLGAKGGSTSFLTAALRRTAVASLARRSPMPLSPPPPAVASSVGRRARQQLRHAVGGRGAATS